MGDTVGKGFEMNSQAEIALSNYMEELDQFLGLCDEFDSSGKWNVRKNGYMSAFFKTDLFSVVLEAMSADGVFENSEAEVISRMFSSEYTNAELRDMYNSLSSVITDYCDGEAEDAVRMLSDIDPIAADQYRHLILSAVDVVSKADGVAEGSEQELIAKLEKALQA